MNTETTIRRTILGIAAAGLGMTIMLSACDFLDPSPEAIVSQSTTTDQECDDITQVRFGSAIYRCECASCHGLDGEPLTEQITDIRNFVSYEKFLASLNNGPASMPSFPQLDSIQRLILFEYVKDSL